MRERGMLACWGLVFEAFPSPPAVLVARNEGKGGRVGKGGDDAGTHSDSARIGRQYPGDVLGLTRGWTARGEGSHGEASEGEGSEQAREASRGMAAAGVGLN